VAGGKILPDVVTLKEKWLLGRHAPGVFLPNVKPDNALLNGLTEM
jgi:hypothetical protein